MSASFLYAENDAHVLMAVFRGRGKNEGFFMGMCGSINDVFVRVGFEVLGKFEFDNVVFCFCGLLFYDRFV